VTDNDAFLQAIIESPEDDNLRLVYADWMDEHGQLERAEFIRVGVQLAHLPGDDPRRQELVARGRKLLNQHARCWLGVWLDRDLVDRLVEAVDFTTLEYDPDLGLYCLNGEPFTGVTKTRERDGTLRAIGYQKDGLEYGLSVAWYPRGRIHLYSEMEADVYHGWHMEWNENGTKKVQAHYKMGRRHDAGRMGREV
jgi:uncharacterized protein (TIGR02996 family)